jgi:hypothetical protein
MDTNSIETAQKVWRWNKNGLGYSSTGYSGTYGLAMTQDGAIVADFITTGTIDASVVNVTNINANNINAGTMSCDRLNGGTISGQTISGGSITLGGSESAPKLQVVSNDGRGTTIWPGGVGVYDSSENRGISIRSSGTNIIGGELNTDGTTVDFTGSYCRLKFTINPSAANTPTGLPIGFIHHYQNSMLSVPTVVVTPETSAPGTKVLGVGVTDVSTLGCTVWLTRTNTTATGVMLIASCIS